MNHKRQMYSLERMKREKLEEMRAIQHRISKIDESIKHHKRLYIRDNLKADQAKEVLAGRSRKNVTDIIKFIFNSLIGNVEYNRYYGKSNPIELMEDDNFVNFMLVEIGAPTITDIIKNFVGVSVHNGEEKLEVNPSRVLPNDNARNRLWKKLTKKTITEEAKRLWKEKNDVQ